MSLPSAVTRYLFNRDQTHRRAICLTLNSDYSISEAWGDVDRLTPAPVPGEDGRNVLPALHGLALDEPIVLEFVGLPTGGTFDIHVFGEGGDVFVLLLPSELAEHKTMEMQQVANEVRLLNDKQQRLLKELEAARADLEIKRRQADEASAIKSRFIASMSHEFRTPLTSVIGYTELLLSDTVTDHDSISHASAIRRSAMHLLSMIDNILDQARIEDGNVPIRLAPLDMRQVADDMASMFAPLAAEKLLGFGAYIDSSVPQWVTSDEVRVRQILVNLIGNAIKFTDSGEIRLEISWAEHRLILLVSDTGPGIEPDQQTRIFEAFHRIGNNDNKRGTGLGLNITARLVELLNGSVTLTSNPGQGSEFAVVVEAPQTDGQEVMPGGALRLFPEHPKQQPIKVLIAEDDPDLTELLSLFLGKGGYTLVFAGDGRVAVDVATKEQPDLVLMDVNMPGQDGLAAARELRSLGFDRPIIALTASQSAKDRDKAFESGCDSYLVKPIGMSELLSTVDRHVNENYVPKPWGPESAT